MTAIAVFLGARDVQNPAYARATRAFGQALAEHEITLVYGGSNTGMMRLLADSVLATGGSVIGVSVKALAYTEAPHQGLTKLHITDNMHERKSKMAELADGFITLPGGIGTLEEFFEAFTWARLGFHSKPIGMLNTDGYYDALLSFIDRSIAEGFFDQSGRDKLLVESNPELLIKILLSKIPER